MTQNRLFALVVDYLLPFLMVIILGLSINSYLIKRRAVIKQPHIHTHASVTFAYNPR